MGLKEDGRINLNQLHIEWQGLPDLVEKWNTKLAEAEEERDTVEGKLKLIRDQIFLDVKANPTNHGYEKVPSDKICTTIAESHDDYQDRLKDFIAAKKEMNLMKSAVKAMSAKKAALGGEVSLWLGKYFSEPVTNIRADTDSIKEKIDEDITEKGKDKLKKTRTRREKRKKRG